MVKIRYILKKNILIIEIVYLFYNYNIYIHVKYISYHKNINQFDRLVKNEIYF